MNLRKFKEDNYWEGFLTLILSFTPQREWANPGSTAIPGQPVARVAQAPNTSPMFKNQFNIEEDR